MVRPEIERALAPLADEEIQVFEPTETYQNVAKPAGVRTLTPARAMVAEMVRRYWVLGSDCTYLEVRKLGWFLERAIRKLALPNPLDLPFTADRYGPNSDRLRHLLNGLDGRYLHSDKRLGDAGPNDTIWVDEAMRPHTDLFWKQAEHRHLLPILEETESTISGFESPLGMELLATVDWLVERENCDLSRDAIRTGLRRWPAGSEAAERKLQLFDDRMIGLALDRLTRSA